MSVPRLSILALLVRAAREGAPAGQVADIVYRAWLGIHAALTPVIGQRGVAALYRRSLHLASADHAALTPLQANVQEMDFGALKAALAQQSALQAAAVGGALLDSFQALVVSLIGGPLTDQLLGGVWTSIFSGSPFQDPP